MPAHAAAASDPPPAGPDAGSGTVSDTGPPDDPTLEPVAAALRAGATAAADDGGPAADPDDRLRAGADPTLVALPPGVLAAVVTWLEMTEAPPPRPDPPGTGHLRLVAWPSPDPAAYRALYRAVGRDWLWFSRLRLDDGALAGLLSEPAVEVYRMTGDDGAALGLLELDFRAMPTAELAFFGLTAGALGRGAGRWLMNRALDAAWRRRPAPDRLTVHTCTLDHPAALDFYRRSGFRPVARAVELVRDPRLDGTLPADAAPQIPTL